MNFFNNKILNKQIICDGDGINITIDTNDNFNMEEVNEEITNLIINIMENNLLKEYIFKAYDDFPVEDREKIYVCASNFFKEVETLIWDSIYSKVCIYTLNNDYINIDGFLKFRLKEFLKYIPTISDKAFEEFIIKRDQDEFVSVLKYFIDMQEEKIDYLKVHIIDENCIMLLDKDGNRIDNIEDEEILNMVLKENLNYEDFLISTLLTLCPKKIDILDSLNNNISKEIIETIYSIFDERVTVLLMN
jgi:putative sporulation protein YtxC